VNNVRPSPQSPVVLRPGSLNILGRTKPADIRLEPFPHILIDDALPQPLFDALSATFPSLEYVARDEATLNNKACLRGAADVVGDPEVSTFRDHVRQTQQSGQIDGSIASTHKNTSNKPIVVGRRAVFPGLRANAGCRSARHRTREARSPARCDDSRQYLRAE
jgi:hypothetical protein